MKYVHIFRDWRESEREREREVHPPNMIQASKSTAIGKGGRCCLLYDECCNNDNGPREEAGWTDHVEIQLTLQIRMLIFFALSI
jgi:hypothetical protein